MKKLFWSLLLLPLWLQTAAAASEQEIVDRSAGMIREFRSMPEQQIPRAVLRDARGLAVLTVVKAGFIFSGKAGHGIVVARLDHSRWSGPSFVGTGGPVGVCRPARK